MKQQNSRSWWRPWVAGVFIAVAVVALVGAVITRYVERNILRTEGFLAVVGPLPEHPKVSASLAKFTTDKVFSAVDTENSIKEFLPPRLAPLAGPLSETLEKRANQTAQNFVQSDAFGAIWTTSNSLLQKGVVRLAESKQGEGRLAAVGSLDLTQLTNAVRERLGSEATTITTEQQEQAAAVRLDLQQRVERLRTTYRAVKTGAYVLPYVAAAFLLAAVAVAYNRRRVVMAIGVTLVLLGVAMLLAFKIISGGILSDISDPIHKASAEVVYEAFYGDLRGRIIAAMAFGGLLILLGLLAGPYAWAKWLRTKFALAKLKKIEPYRWAQSIRRLAGKYEPWLLLAGAAAVIIWLLVLSTLTPATLVVILSLLVAYASLIHLIARPSPSHALV